jgi:tryptophan halogenase
MTNPAPLEIVIVGGGTAGWMAAAALGALLPPGRCNIRLVESEEIGIVGVGEATLPHMKSFNDAIGVDEAEMMRRTSGTFKLGIDFVDWGYKGSSYVHPFGIHGNQAAGNSFHHHWLRALQNGEAAPIEDYSFAIVASRRNRFAFPAEDRSAIESTYGYAYHFDASLYAVFLREFSEARGVRRTEGKVVEVLRDPESGDVASLRMESGEIVAGDFFVDCSGFRSLILGQTLGVEFEEWTKWLPCDRAFAVPTQRQGELTPYTRSTCREAGWQWRIPLQHRTGNGYVFSSGFIGDDEAAANLMANLDAPALAEPRMLRFKAGRRANSWERNCLALGLASGFLEPLESTSIYLVQIAIMNLIALLPERKVDPALREEYNRRQDLEYERIRDFLILHYHATSRDDAEIWRYCRAMEVPDSLKAKIEMFRHRGYIEHYKDGLFTPPSWLSVYLGQGIEPEGYHPMADAMPIERLTADLHTLREEISRGVDAMPPHGDFVARYCPHPAAPSEMSASEARL